MAYVKQGRHFKNNFVVQIQQKIQAFDLKLNVNKVNEDDDLEIVEKVVASLQKQLGTKVELITAFSEKNESCWRWSAKRNTLPVLEGVKDGVYSFAQNRSGVSAINA